MNVVLPKQFKIRKRDMTLYILSIVICIISLIIIITMQFLGESVFPKNKIELATEEELLRLKTEFENMFTNQFIGEVQDVVKKEEGKDLVFTSYERQENKAGTYTLDIHIPQFNMPDETVNAMNQEIAKMYKQQVNEILNTQENQTIYAVEYVSFIEKDVLFLIIRSTLKQGNVPQQAKIDTYQYDLQAKKRINLQEMIEKLQYDANEIQNKIREEIQKQEQNSKNLQELGYSIYVRDSNSDIYKIENTKQFFLRNGKLYMIYSYENEAETSDMDLVIL